MKDEWGNLATTIYKNKYSMDGKEEWSDTAYRVASSVMGAYLPDLVGPVTRLIEQRKFMPGGRYLYAAGRPFHQVNNCVLTTVEDSKEGWAWMAQRYTRGLMTGAGFGGVYSALREEGAKVNGLGGFSTGPLSMMNINNEIGRHVMQGGSRRSAMWAGLHWNHTDIFKFATAKNWSDDIKRLKEKDFNFPAPLDMTNISIILDDDFFAAYENPSHDMYGWAHDLYSLAIHQMLTTGEPGFSIDVGINAGEHLRNACTEVTSADDNDVCNLGSLNLARIESRGEYAEAVELATAFLVCGSIYSDLPYPEVGLTRDKNRRLGLGNMGVYEWLVTRGRGYRPDAELGQWLDEYAKSTEIAGKYADLLNVSRPVKTRAMAPTGTISMIAETTSSIEPLFAPATKRRYLQGKTWKYQYTVDSIAQRLYEQGVDPDSVPSAYVLAKNPEDRVAFQAWFQGYVDHGISSTLNLPAPEEHAFSEVEFGRMLYGYLPDLRGVTCYPNGSRGGQPLTAVPFADAASQVGVEFEETSNEKACVGGVCGI